MPVSPSMALALLCVSACSVPDLSYQQDAGSGRPTPEGSTRKDASGSDETGEPDAVTAEDSEQPDLDASVDRSLDRDQAVDAPSDGNEDDLLGNDAHEGGSSLRPCDSNNLPAWAAACEDSYYCAGASNKNCNKQHDACVRACDSKGLDICCLNTGQAVCVRAKEDCP